MNSPEPRPLEPSQSQSPLAENAARPRRDRRGRGIRGDMIPSNLPGSRSKRDRFDALVHDAIESIERHNSQLFAEETQVSPTDRDRHRNSVRWLRRVGLIEIAVEDVPPSDPTPWELDGIPLGKCYPGDVHNSPRIVVYRRPIEVRAESQTELATLIFDVLIEQIAHLFGKAPEDIDPR